MLSKDDLAKAFTLEGNDLREIRSLRTAKNRLGYAVLLTSMRCVGTFPGSPKEVPSDITSYLCAQIGIEAGTSLTDYFISKTLERHVRYIREQHGFAYFADAPHLRFGLTRWLYTECWVGNDRPGALVLQAADWLVAHNVILPGLSALERLVGRVRERASQRLFARLANGLTAEQHSRISGLFERDGDDLNRLEILRASPLKRRQSDFWTHLDRLDAVRDFDLSSMPPKGVPATQLERMARIARRTKPSAIAAWKEPRRTATVAALFYTLEASAQDGTIELGDALIADLFREAELAQASHRHAHQRSLDAAIVLLRDLAGLITTDDKLPHNDWRDMVYRQMPKESIEGAILAVDALVKPTVGKPYAELTAAWRRAHKLFFSVTTRIDAAASPGGADVIQAMEWLRAQGLSQQRYVTRHRVMPVL